ncbi:MAG TPA: 4Fe-4S dicluster domain-containing protein [Candidatus Alistipes pullicola]|nr:4Fe-4S dicluster domain-containing protein [Candidatus Alistipes pullicola]
MGKYFDMLQEDVRVKEGLAACMNCGICTGVCPAASYYDYDPRQIVNIVQTQDDAAIEKLMRSDTIWYCGECMSCRPRCPRGNTPGYIIQALRSLSQRLGFFVDSEKGRQQLALKRTIGRNIMRTGYCLRPDLVDPDLHPEQGPVWRWIYDHDKDVFERFGDNYCKPGVGACRKIDDRSMEEIHRIFEVTGGAKFFENIEECSDKKAHEMGYADGADDTYFMDVLTTNNGMHSEK